MYMLHICSSPSSFTHAGITIDMMKLLDRKGRPIMAYLHSRFNVLVREGLLERVNCTGGAMRTHVHWPYRKGDIHTASF